MKINSTINIVRNNLYAISLYIRKIAGAFSIFFIARCISVHDYGVYASYSTIIGYLLLFANLGFNEYILVSTNKETKRVKLKQSLFIVFAICLCLIYGIVSLFVPLENHIVFLLLIVKLFFDGTFFALVLPYFQASNKFKEIGIINIIYSFAIFAAAISALIFKLTLVKYLLICLIVGLINFIQCSAFIKINYFKFLTKIKDFTSLIDKSILPYIGVTLLFVTREQLPSLFVATFIDKETAALYFAAYTIATVPSLFASAQLQQLMPEMIKVPKDEVISVMKRGAKTIFYINIAVLIFLIIFGKLLLHLLYGKTYYSNGYYILIFLSLITTASGVAGPLGTYITAGGNQKFKLKCQIEFFVISLISLLVLYRFGIYAILSMFFILMTYSIPRFWLFIKKELAKE